jgi:hypothetical protein
MDFKIGEAVEEVWDNDIMGNIVQAIIVTLMITLN